MIRERDPPKQTKSQNAKMTSKTRLQEFCQKNFKMYPLYATTRSKIDPGDDHVPNFDCTLTLPIPDGRAFQLTNYRSNKAGTEAELASRVLSQLEEEALMQEDLLARMDRLGPYSISLPSPPRVSDKPENVSVIRTHTAKIIQINQDSVVARAAGVKGKIRLSGDFAKNLRSGMIVEVRVLEEIPGYIPL